jgi:tRNA (Thr-GGU) A37 N-methylase
VGVLATRSPVRPNPLGITVVKLLEKRGNVLKVIGLDAIDGTPVVDIKPCLPGDSVTQIEVPDWINKLRQCD